MRQSPETPLRVAIVGCGRMGKRHAIAVSSHPAGELVGVCDTEGQRARELGDSSRVRSFDHLLTMLQETAPQAVIIATPDHLHCEVALASLEAGCHVFCEKPLASSFAEAQQMVNAAARRGVSLAVNYNRRYGFAYRKAKEHLNTGGIGPLQQVLVQVTDGVPPPHVARSPYVMLSTLLTHHIDLVRFLAGEIRTVQATFGPPVDGLHRQTVLAFELAGGAVAAITANYRERQSRTAEFALLQGELGSLFVDDVVREMRWTGPNQDETLVLRPDPFSPGTSFYDTVQAHVHDWLDRLTEGQAPLVTGRDGLRGMQVVAGAIASWERRQTISVDTDADHD